MKIPKEPPLVVGYEIIEQGVARANRTIELDIKEAYFKRIYGKNEFKERRSTATFGQPSNSTSQNYLRDTVSNE